MMGPSILVAPVFTGQTERKVVLPKGNWYDFYTGKYAGNGEIVTIKTRLDQIPLFVKDGAIIPMLKATKATDQKNNGPLEVRHYGTKENQYILYNDDGESYDYEKGEYAQTELSVERKRNGELVGKSTSLSKKFNYGKITWRWMTKQQ